MIDPPVLPGGFQQGIEGDVGVSVLVDATGKVTRVQIIKASAYPEFNEAARAAAQGEVFEPARKDGAAMPSILSFVYHFRLDRD